MKTRIILSALLLLSISSYSKDKDRSHGGPKLVHEIKQHSEEKNEDKGTGGNLGEGIPDREPVGTAVPFDFGLSILIAAGVGYAAKRKYDTRIKTKEL